MSMMAADHACRRSSKLPNNSALQLNLDDDLKQIIVTNIIHDGQRFKWISNWEKLKDFVKYSLELNGKWTSPGGYSRKFICSNLDLTITWYPGKQNSLILHGKLSNDLSNILLTACQKKINGSIVEINAFPMSNNMHNGSLPITQLQDDVGPSVMHYKNDSESSCVNSLCNTQCDCKCGLLAAELEGIKLDIVIMQRSIEYNNLATNTIPENEFKRLEKELAKEKEKSTQLEKDISILVRGRDAEVSELNNIIISLQNKLEANEALTNKQPTPRIDYIPTHKLNGAKEQLFSETKDHLSLSEFSVNNYMINNDINQTKKQDQVSQKQIPSTQVRVKTPIHSKPAATPIPRRVTNTNKTKLKQNNYQPIPTRITARKQRKKAQRKESQPVNGCRNVGYGRNGGYTSNEFRDKEVSYQICPEMKTNDNSMSRCNNYTINRGFRQDLKKKERIKWFNYFY